MKTTFIAFFALICITGALGGRISAWGDIEVYHPNKGQITTMDLFVSLDNKLPTGHLLRFTLPFTASPSITSVLVYTQTSLTKGAFFAAPGTPVGTLSATGTLSKQVTTAPFHNYYSFDKDLAAATQYVVRITFTTSPTDVGYLGHIQLETLSPAYSITGAGNGGSSDIAITYDLNNAFAPLHIFAAPGTLTVTSTADANAAVAGASSVRQFKITPSQSFYYWPTIVLSWTSSSFTVSNLTSIDTGVNASAVIPLTSGTGAGQYSWTTSGNSLVILHNQPLTNNTPITYNVTIANPASQLSTAFSVSIYHRYNYNLTDMTTSTIAVALTSGTTAASTAVLINAQSILLSWGLDRNVAPISASTALQKAFTIFASANTNPQYQAMNFIFGVNTSISNSAGYKVTLNICAAYASCDVLENSIVSNMTGASCAVTVATGVAIYCNTSAIATTGNSIAARIWLYGATGGAGVISGSQAAGWTLNDTTFGTIAITIGTTTTNATNPSSQPSSPYLGVAFHTAPLINLNGNGPATIYPNGGSLWAVAPSGATSYTGITSGTGNTAYTGWPTVSATTPGNVMGGIYTATTAGKYNMALYTNAIMFAPASGYSTFSPTVNGVSAVTTLGANVQPGLDLFLNPNLFTTSGTNQIAKCWLNNLANQYSGFSSSVTEVAGVASTTTGLSAAHCYTNTVSGSYLRLRLLTTTKVNTAGIATGQVANAAAAVESTGTTKYMSFFWEAAFNMSAYAGSSLRADQNVPDFYGIFYTATFKDTPSAPGATGNSTNVVADLGELASISTSILAASNGLLYGYPIFWNQMLLGPYGAYAAVGAAPTYYNSKEVFITNYDTTAADTFTSAHFVYLMRVRGLFNTGSGAADAGVVPTGGKLALFLVIPVNNVQWEPLGAVGFTTGSTANTYSGAATAFLGTVPLVGNGAIRCFSAAGNQNCLSERRGRALASAVATGALAQLDFSQVITSDVAYSANFSLAIVVKPKLLAFGTLVTYLYRLGFISNNLAYIQSWDQNFDNGAALAANGVVTPVAASFGGSAVTPAQAPYKAVPATQACVIPYVSGGATGQGIRFIPAATDTDNSVVTANISINAITAITPSLKQGAVTWCVGWNFKASSTFKLPSVSFENSTIGDVCNTFDYLTETLVAMYCLYCPISSSTAVPASAGTAVSFNITGFTTGTAVNVLQTTSAAFAADTGAIQELGLCTGITGTSGANVWLPNTITALTTSGSAFNLSGQKLTISFTASSGIAYTTVDTITLTGRNQTSSGADTNFPYGTIDSTNYVCRLVPQATATNVSTMTACTATITGGLITVTPTASAITSNTTSWSLIIWGFNGNLSAANSPTSTWYYMQTLKSSTVVDSSNTTNSALATWSLNTSPVLNFTTATVGYQRPIIGARGYFRFDFGFSSRNWYNGDKIVLSVDGIVTSTINANTSVVKCRITDTSAAENILQMFQSCTLAPSATPATLTIYALPTSISNGQFDFVASGNFRVYLDNMVTLTPQTNKVIYGNVYFNTGSTASLTKNTTGTDITAQNLTTAQTMTTGYTLTKFFAAANDYSDLIFTLTSASAITSSSRITVAFPSYYNPGLASRSNAVYCTVNGVYAMCAVGVISNLGALSSLEQGSRTVAVWGVSSSINANTTFSLRISGVRAPPAAYVAENFYVQINTDNSESLTTIASAAAITDSAYAAQTVNPLNVVWFSVGASTTRTLTTMTWTVGLNTTGTTSLNTSQVIAVYFPEYWGLAWGVFTPTCSVTDATNTSLTYASTQTAYGNQIFLNISTAIPTTAVVILSCQNMRTGDNDGVYLGNSDITIRVVDANGTNVYQRSAPGAHNVNFNLAMKATLSYVNWNASTSFSSLSNPQPLTAGTYSLNIAATLSAASNRTFTITPSNSNFGFLSTAAPFYLTTGATSNTTLLGCSSSVPAGIYGINFNISDSSLYTTLPRLWVNVNNIPQTIGQSAAALSTYFVAASTTSSYAPLTFDVSSIPPYADITITPVAPILNTNFTFTPASIKLTAASPKNYFVFSTTSGATAAGAATYTFTVSGTNAASYSTPTPVTLTLAADTNGANSGTPNFTITADSTDTSSPTTKILTVTLSSVTQATIYWCVALRGQAITDATALQTNGALWTQYGSGSSVWSQYSANTANQMQCGQFYQTTSPSKSPANFAIHNLFPGVGYTVSAVAVSLANKTSSVFQFDFGTASNGFAMQRWLFNYTTYPSQAQRQTLLCTITQMLAVPSWSVRDVNGEICGNTTAFYNVSNSTGDLGVYFYPLQTTTETVMTNLQTNLNATAKITSLNTTIANTAGGLGFVGTVYPDSVIKNAQPGTTFPSSASVGQTWASFSGLALNDTGFVFIAIGSNTTTAPTAVAFKQAAAGINTNTGLSQIQVLYYYPGGGSLSYNFTGLSVGTSYNAFVMASNNDPSALQNFTTVSTVPFTTSTVSTGTTGSPIGVVFSVMAVFASVISLMFF